MAKVIDDELFPGELVDAEELLEGYEPDPNLQSVLLCFQFPRGKLDTDQAFNALMEYEDVLRDIMDITELGDVDGHEFCEGDEEHSITFFLYGKEADKIYDAVLPTIAYIPFSEGSYILKQYAGLEQEVEKIEL